MTKMKKTIKNNDLSTKPLAFYPNSFVPPNLEQMENFKDVAEHKGYFPKEKHTGNTL